MSNQQEQNDELDRMIDEELCHYLFDLAVSSGQALNPDDTVGKNVRGMRIVSIRERIKSHYTKLQAMPVPSDEPSKQVSKLLESFHDYINDQPGEASSVTWDKVYAEQVKKRVEILSAIMQLIATLHPVSHERCQEEHWYKGTYGRDANGMELGHICQCGYKARSKEVVNQHVNWKLASLTNPKPPTSGDDKEKE